MIGGPITTISSSITHEVGLVVELDEGYKGFNPTGISQIIRRTDPRTETVGA